MAQNIALQSRTPMPDLAAITRAAQDANLMDYKLQNAPAQSELEGLQLQDEIGGQKALSGYRDAAGKGDPNAIDKMAAYPKMQQDLYSAFDGMDAKSFAQAQKKARAFGKAAQHVKMFPDGSPQQEQAWGASAKVLKEAGYIDDKQFNMMIESGPSDLMIQQAMTVDQWVSQYTKKGDDKSPEMKKLEVDKIRAEIEKINRTGADDESSALKLKLLEAQIDKINAQTESEKTGDKKSTAAEMAEKGRNMRAARKEIGEFATKAMEFATTPEEIQAAQTQIAEKRAEIMDFYGLTNESEATPPPTGAVDPEVTAPSAEGNALQQAKEAIAAGADRDAVLKRLEENGIDASGL